MRYLYYILIFLLLSITIGCGYHPRPQNVLPAQLHYIYLDSANKYGEFESTLRHSLELLGAHVFSCSRYGAVHIHLLDVSIFYGTPTIGGSNQARVYNLYYQVIFEVRDAGEQVILPPQTVKTSNSLIINPGEALESTNQLAILKFEMQKEVCRMILNILISPRLFHNMLAL